jgi:hypothetical protein
MSSQGRVIRLLVRIVRFFPASRTSSRIGRVLSFALGGLGVDVVTTIPLNDGSLMVMDTRGRTESEAVWTGDYDPGLLSFLTAAIDVNGPNVIDVGANVGLLAVPLARRVAPLGGTVLAIEPVAANAKRLQESIALNGLRNVLVEICAAGSHSGEATLTREDAFGQTSGNALIDIPNIREPGAPSGVAATHTG